MGECRFEFRGAFYYYHMYNFVRDRVRCDWLSKVMPDIMAGGKSVMFIRNDMLSECDAGKIGNLADCIYHSIGVRKM